MEDSVPPEEKPKARGMIKDKLKFIRDNTFSPRVVLTPRTNGITTGLF
jgi:citrate lyase beta subunit